MVHLFSINLVLLYTIGKGDFNTIPNYVYDFCEYADICNRSATKQPPPGKISCCKSCSCDDDCGLKLNCCFDYLDKYKLEENDKVTCIEPVDGTDKGGLHTKHYFMVTSCSYFGSAIRSKEGDCHWVDDDGGSLLAPVTDIVSNTTFVNEDCAQCNNVNNTVKWNYIYSEGSTFSKKHSSILWRLETNFERQKGIKIFVPPENIKLSTKECYRSLFHTCKDTSPYYNVCQSLNAPITSIRTEFKNVGCMFCLKKQSEKECVDQSYLLRFYSGTFTVLIDYNVLESISFEQNKGKGTADKMSHDASCPSWSVKSHKKDRCLQTYCPESMFRTIKGCQYLFVLWYAKAILLRVKLEPASTTFLPVSNLQTLSKHDLSDVSTWMELPCYRLKPFLIDIYYENASLKLVKSMDVTLKKNLYKLAFSPSVFLPQLKKCAERPWHIHLRNSSYELIPKLSRYYNYVQDGSTYMGRNKKERNEEFVRPKLYDKLTKAPMKEPTGRGLLLDIKKTFFCRQVRVPFDEVEINVAEIRILSTNKTLGNNEFDVNNASLMGLEKIESSVSMCLEDYLMGGTDGEKGTDGLIGYVLLLYIFIIVFEILGNI